MRIETKYFGEVAIESTSVLDFPSGIPGFNHETQFVLLDFPDNPLFQILQSTTSKETAFIVVNPYHLYEEYTLNLDESIIEILQLSSEEEVVVLSIVTLKAPFTSSTINLKAPIIINSVKNKGKQLIINTDEYPTRAPISPKHSSKVKGE
ncbi:MAG: flagellar assembly protein FliW [Bacillota bacterium]|uniref:Flagellar assembly factor FliW n=1 Tax=Virgibacillus salarius TaxID=447199 RepID=A0A941IBL2_9BACI|nr:MULTISPECIES: flagellar assembly protein FliW [Virgibacillus]NAZ10593.1 flagellar assembly protein FliW [Agaribacter marinus]MBR7797883.1 flagellar assembly protein FliW [Virgibacillus salarius]MCC2251048.1 flagellar assembly protein FliW [Virgibacillus sp. AGTR]MDY7042870.1 flagellar assembly protein FliW [Virgibacillus sp. M23]QRZ18038.1 flagellar assembly protein FliW [Virgibacillus sp. AGTR]